MITMEQSVLYSQRLLLKTATLNSQKTLITRFPINMVVGPMKTEKYKEQLLYSERVIMTRKKL